MFLVTLVLDTRSHPEFRVPRATRNSRFPSHPEIRVSESSGTSGTREPGVPGDFGTQVFRVTPGKRSPGNPEFRVTPETRSSE
jgi:hypothetical protein